jgi:hypothetical protein
MLSALGFPRLVRALRMITLFGFGGRGRLTLRLAIRIERLRRGMGDTMRVSVFNGVGCGNGLADVGIEYERQKLPDLSQPRSVRRAGDRADRGVRDYGFGAAADPEALPLGCAGSSMGFGETIKRGQAEPSYNRVDLASRCWEKPV